MDREQCATWTVIRAAAHPSQVVYDRALSDFDAPGADGAARAPEPFASCTRRDLERTVRAPA